jgi:spore germination cell wall hydrolase CwlJ-like protein
MRGLRLFCTRSLLLVFVLLGLAAPAHAGDVAANEKTSVAAHNKMSGLASAAQAIAAQSLTDDELGIGDASTALNGVSAAALEVTGRGLWRNHLANANYARQLRCLAEGMYFEARGEPWRGQLAVGRVILNRVSSKHYPDSICDVVYQNSHLHNRCQFSFACDGKADVIRNAKVWYDVRGYAAWLLANRPNEREVSEYRVLASLQTATHYHADYVQPHWAEHFELTARIGRHIFYSDPSA